MKKGARELSGFLALSRVVSFHLSPDDILSLIEFMLVFVTTSWNVLGFATSSGTCLSSPQSSGSCYTSLRRESMGRASLRSKCWNGLRGNLNCASFRKGRQYRRFFGRKCTFIQRLSMNEIKYLIFSLNELEVLWILHGLLKTDSETSISSYL